MRPTLEIGKDMSFLTAPTEKDVLRRLGDKGISSTLPEKYGSDFLVLSPRGKCGLQRKHFPEDFFASLQDGRTAREVALMAQLDYRVWVIEGKPYYDDAGHLISEGNSRWTRSSLRNLAKSYWIQHGIMVEYTEDIDDTIALVEEWESYLRKGKHVSLLTRQKNGKLDDEWGKLSKRDWARYFLQGFPGVGITTAEAIFDHFGRVPMEWSVTERELQEVWGIGPKRARTLVELFK